MNKTVINKNIETLILRDLEYNPSTKLLKKDGKRVPLRKKETELIEFLLKNQDRIISKEELLDALWGDVKLSSSNTLAVHLKNLRNKIGNGYIVTVNSMGYLVE